MKELVLILHHFMVIIIILRIILLIELQKSKMINYLNFKLLNEYFFLKKYEIILKCIKKLNNFLIIPE